MMLLFPMWMGTHRLLIDLPVQTLAAKTTEVLVLLFHGTTALGAHGISASGIEEADPRHLHWYAEGQCLGR